MFKMFFKKKKNYNDYFYNLMGFLQFFGLILLCSGTNSCPESTRPHLTQCDKYFRCNQLPNKTYVWIPAQCDKGLVYEPSLKICVLPGDNWECNLTEELTSYQILNDENNVYGINNIQLGDYISEEIVLNDLNATSFEDLDSSENNNSSELFIDISAPLSRFNTSVEDLDEYESSGDEIYIPEIKEYSINNTSVSIPESIDFDNRLTSHLQRLTQLVDSIKNQNHSKDDTRGELMADQLNHFLDNYNLMTQQNYDVNDTSKIPISEDGHMHPDHIDEIISQQSKLTIDDVIKHTVNAGLHGGSVLYPIQEPNVDIKFNSAPQESIKKGYRKPEINVPQSQIIINRPGGSVLFSIDSYNQFKASHSAKPHREEPIISEETLKTVLELSNQLIHQNNNRQVYPIYYTVPIPVITEQKRKHSSHKRYYTKPPISVQNSFNTINEGSTKSHPNTINSGNHDGGNNISTTVIFQRQDPPPAWIPNSDKHKPDHKHHVESVSSHKTTIYSDPNSNSPTFSTYYDPSSSEYNHKPDHKYHDESVSSHKTAIYANPNSNSPTFSTYYDPSSSVYNHKPDQKHHDESDGSHENIVYTDPNSNSPTFSTYYDPSSSQYNHKPGHKHHDESVDSHETIVYTDPNNNSPTFSTYYDPNSAEYNHKPDHNHHDVSLSSDETIVYENPDTNSPTYPSYYDPSSEDYNSYQPPNYPPQYQPTNPYENSNSYYQGPQNVYPPFLPTPFYPDFTSTTTTPAPTTTKTTKTSTTTESYSSEDNDGEKYSYSSSGTTGNGNFGLTPFNSYNPLASSLGLLQLNDDNQDKLINFGGSFISYNSYKNTLLPLLQPSTLGGGLEILTCSTGVRQPNMTDCSRYYVCNPRTQNVLSYACPPFTAFNKGTKICDAKSYAVCKPEAILNRYTVAENMRLQQEAQKALAEAQKIRNDVLKNSALASLLQSQNIGSLGPLNNKPINIIQADSVQPIVPNQTTTKRRIRCYDTGKISDPDSPRNYWVCFRGPNGRMKRQKMTCANGLLFCKNTRYCTLPKKC